MQSLPMGLCNGPNIFQEKMSELFHDIETVRTYIDDLLVVTNGSFEEHLSSIYAVPFMAFGFGSTKIYVLYKNMSWVLLNVPHVSIFPDLH